MRTPVSYFDSREPILRYQPYASLPNTILSLIITNFLSSYDVPENKGSTSYTLSYMITKVPYHDPHLTDGKTEALRRYYVWHPKHISSGLMEGTQIFQGTASFILRSDIFLHFKCSSELHLPPPPPFSLLRSIPLWKPVVNYMGFIAQDLLGQKIQFISICVSFLSECLF